MRYLFRRRTLFRDLVLVLSIITVVSVTVLGSLLYAIATVREEARIKRNAQRMTGEIIRAIALPLMNFDRDTVVQIADAYLSSDFVDGMRINVEGTPFYESYGNRSGLVMSLNRDVRVNGLKAGQIQVMFSKHSLRHMHVALFWVMMAILASAVLIGIPVMYVLVRRLVGIPMAHLKDGLDRVADGTSDEPLSPLPQQDMNDIIQAVNRMAEKIRKRTRELRDSEARFRDIFENAGHGIFQMTPDGTLLRANRSMAAILGFDSREELMEQFDFILDQGVIPVHPRVSPDRGKGLTRTLDVYETRVVKKDNRPVWVRIKARQVCDEAGAIYCIEGFIDDVTQQKTMQEEVLKAKDNLESQVEARTQRLKEKTETMERMNRLFVDRELAMKALKEENRSLRDRVSREVGEAL